MVLGWMANSSSASMVVTRTLICREGQGAMRTGLLVLIPVITISTAHRYHKINPQVERINNLYELV